MDKPTFSRGLSWLLFLNLLIKPVWIFVIDRQVQVTVGNTAYGQYFALFGLTYIFLFLADAGLTNLLNLKLAKTQPVSTRQLLQVKLTLLFFYAAACLLFALVTGTHSWTLLLYLIGIQSLASLFLFLRSMVTAQQHFTSDAFFSVLDKLLMVALCLPFLYTALRPISILLFVQLQLLATAISTGAVLIYVYRNLLFVESQRWSLRSLVYSVAPFATIVLLMATHYRLDGFLLERLHINGAAEAGVYAAAYRLTDAANMVGYLTASFLVPFIARNLLHQKRITLTVLPIRNALLLLSGGAVAFLFVFGEVVYKALYHNTLQRNILVMQWSFAVLPAYYLVHVYGSLLTATAQLRRFIYLLLGSVVLNTALNLFLIPSMGAMGCCLAALASQYLLALGCFFTASAKTEIPLSLSTFCSCVATGFAAYFVFRWAQNVIPFLWIILAALGMAATGILLVRRHALNHPS